jgi:hypothetical protein
MKPTSGQFFTESTDDDRPEYSEYRTPGDEPMKHQAMNYVPNMPNYNKEKIVRLPGKSLREYYSKKKKR